MNIKTPNLSINHAIRPALITAAILMIPFVGTRVSIGWNWGILDFVIIGTILFSAGMTYEIASRNYHSTSYKVAAALASITGVLLAWVTLAVAIIGDDNPANYLYIGVLALGFFGSTISRFEPKSMAKVMFATAIAQMIVPIIGLLFWSNDFAPGAGKVLAINALVAMSWIGSGLLFRNSSTVK